MTKMIRIWTGEKIETYNYQSACARNKRERTSKKESKSTSSDAEKPEEVNYFDL